MQQYGCQSMTSPIRRILLKHPKDAYKNQLELNKYSSKLNYLETPDFLKAISDYDKFVDLLKLFNIEIHFLPENNNANPDSIYTHDPCVITNYGVILCSMGKKERQSEIEAVQSFFKSIKIPILGRIKNPGKLEGGDIVWINKSTIAVGEGYRTNQE